MKIVKIIHALVFVGLLLFGMFLFIFSPKNEISEDEKRKLASLPTFSWPAVWDGSYMHQIQKYVDDHFPFRSSLVDLAFVLNENKGVKSNNNVRLITTTNTKKVDEKKIDLNKAARDINYLVNAESSSSHGLLIIEGRAFQVFGGTKSAVKGYIDVVNEYRELLPENVRIFNCIVPSSSSFIFVKEYDYLRERECNNIDDAYSMTNSGVINVKAKESLIDHQNEYIYFSSDHHWTGLGAYYAYSAFCDAAGLKAAPLSKMTRKVKRNFLGTLYNMTKDESIKNNPDSVEYFIPPVDVQPKIFAEFASGGNSYGVFLGGDIPHLKFHTSVENGRSVVVIKNSYGNPFSTFLVNNYETVHVVDYRYFNKGLVKLIKSEGIDDVIFFHNVFSANTLSHSQRQRIIKNPVTDEVKPESKPVKKTENPNLKNKLNNNNSVSDTLK